MCTSPARCWMLHRCELNKNPRSQIHLHPADLGAERASPSQCCNDRFTLQDLISLESHTFQDITTKRFITPNPWTLDVTDACIVLNHFFATAGVKWPRVHSHTNSLEWPCFFPWDSLIKGAQPAPRSSPNLSLYFLLSRRPLWGSVCDKYSLSMLGVPGFPLQLGGLSSLHCCPPFHALPMAIVELFISILPVPAAIAEQNSQHSHKLSSMLVALLYPQRSAEAFSSPYISLL